MLTNFFYTLLGRIVKELLLPEIKKLIESETNELRDEIKELKAMIFEQSKRIDHLSATLNARIDETNKRIDETNIKIDKSVHRLDVRLDENNKNIAILALELGNVKKELEKLKRDESVTSDILYRLRELEKKVIAA